MSTSPTIFVSHSHLDNAFGMRLIRDLRARLGDSKVWYDIAGGLHGGDDFRSEISHQLTAREVFLVILSPNALASTYVQWEMNLAYFLYISRTKRLMPIRYQPCELPADWDMLNWRPCRDPQLDGKGYAQDFETIVADLLQVTKDPTLDLANIQLEDAERHLSAQDYQKALSILERMVHALGPQAIIGTEIKLPSRLTTTFNTTRVAEANPQVVTTAETSGRARPIRVNLPLVRILGRAFDDLKIAYVGTDHEPEAEAASQTAMQLYRIAIEAEKMIKLANVPSLRNKSENA